ncbi:MAG: CHAP domain-containing protein [Nocardioides sp.]
MTSIRRFLSALLVTVVLGALFAATPPAAAYSTYLCTGYVGCQEKGYSNFGYRQASGQMWWRMYTGHNCTNYVAYRMVKDGMSAERPWSGTGMAYNWGWANPRITDDKPMVGAVAWWKRNVPGAGSSGHVAYVEKVLSAGRIVISEDSWSGDFHWRRITKSGTGWPTGFIHFKDRRVTAKTRPAITGSAAVGETLVASRGRWTPAASYSFQWLADGRSLRGATSARLTVSPELHGSRLSVRVTARARGYLDGRSTSERTPGVVRGTMETLDRPAILGTARVGEVLTLQRGAWSPAPDTTVIRWYADGRLIDGVDGGRLRLDQPHIGTRITVRTTARREGYQRSALTSPPTTEVTAGRIRVSTPFELQGVARMGARLRVEPGTFTPAGASVSYTWLRNGRAVAGATGTSYDLGVADVGKRMSVRVKLRHPGYRDRVVSLPATERIRTRPTLHVRSEGRPGRALVRLRVTAPGVETPGGRATIRVGIREVTGRLEDGRLRVVVRNLTPGLRTVRVTYAGTDVVLPGRARTTVKVLRRR